MSYLFIGRNDGKKNINFRSYDFYFIFIIFTVDEKGKRINTVFPSKEQSRR